jgi:arginyl-tRNA--protein-N-Asp/Glu arginylyltransferase
MKELAAPPQPDFDSYIGRPETRYLEREGESLELLYNQGYLPYSSSKGLQGIFYTARSARVALNEFALSSENRRIAKKFDGQFKKRRIAIQDFNADDAFYSFVAHYFAQRHGANVAPRARIELWMQSGLVSTIVEYRQDERIIGYVLEVEEGRMRHFWFSAYDLLLAQQSLGLWLMLDCLRDAAAAGSLHYYLGTVYGTKALYKTNFASLEWHDGLVWSRDLELLKQKSRAD